MPSAYAGTTTVPSTTPWFATTSYTSGDFVTPSTPDGQYFQCTTSGTSDGTEPAWNNPSSLPVPGQTFIDNTVVWTCIGSILTNQACIVDIPVDSDPSVVAAVGRALVTLANYASTTAQLAGDNVWTGTNTFDNYVEFDGNGTEYDPFTQYGNNAPTHRRLVAQSQVDTGAYSHIYADHDFLGTFGWLFTVNANWNGTAWSCDDSSLPANGVFIADSNFIVMSHVGTGSTWSNAQWVIGLNVNTGTTPASASLSGALSVGTTLAVVDAATLGATVQIGGKVTQVNGISTAGNFGANATVASAGLLTSITSAQTLATYTPQATSLIRLDVFAYGPTPDSPYISMAFKEPSSGTSITLSGDIVMSGVQQAGSNYLWTGTYLFAVASASAVTAQIQQHASETIISAYGAITAIA